MHDLPKGTLLGHLTLGAVLELYDFPRLFSCTSSTGQLYVAVSTYDDDERTEWLYLPVSSLRFKSLLSNEISLYSAFRRPEGGFVFQVFMSLEAAPTVNHLLPDQISDDDLPTPDYRVASPEVVVQADGYFPPKQVAIATRRETFDYRMFRGLPDLHEVPARKLGAILSTTQELIDALGQSALGQATIRGPIATEVLQTTKVNVTHTFIGSFGVQFSAAESNDLLPESTLSDALRAFAQLVEARDSETQLRTKLRELKGRVASKYRRLLKELSDIHSGLFMDWGSVSESRGGEFELTPSEVKMAYHIVDQYELAQSQEVSVTGKLVGYNSRTERYELQSSDDGRTYAGKVAADAKLEVANPAIGQFYQADIRMLVETQSSSGDELIRWLLVRLAPLDKSPT